MVRAVTEPSRADAACPAYSSLSLSPPDYLSATRILSVCYNATTGTRRGGRYRFAAENDCECVHRIIVPRLNAIRNERFRGNKRIRAGSFPRSLGVVLMVDWCIVIW